jgi:hypothetical protein
VLERKYLLVLIAGPKFRARALVQLMILMFVSSEPCKQSIFHFDITTWFSVLTDILYASPLLESSSTNSSLVVEVANFIFINYHSGIPISSSLSAGHSLIR